MITGLITVRSASSRLPSKCYLPFGDGCVLEHVIRRAKAAGIDPIVCTTIEAEDDRIAVIAEAEGARLFRGVVANKLRRWRDCCREFGLDSFHTVDADDPFFDGEEMKASHRMLLDEGWDMVAPTQSSSAGAASVGYSLRAEIIEKAVAIAGEGEDVDTEMMWFHVNKVPGLKSTVLPENRPTPITARVTLDYEEDYWLLVSVLRMVGATASREDVDALFHRNPDLYKVNWFRNDDWAAGQESKKV